MIGGFVLLLCGLGGPDDSPAAASRKAEDVTLKGKAVTLGTALQRAKVEIRVDPEPIAKQVVLVGEDGAITPLLSDEASRALFLDERLRDRPAEIQGQAVRGVALSPGHHVQDRAGRPVSDARILLQYLHDQRSISRRSARAARGRWSCG